MDFEQYWNELGELHASMCNGDIKVFAEQIWGSATAHNKDYAAARKVFLEWINPLQGEEVTFENYTLWLDARLNSED